MLWTRLMLADPRVDRTDPSPSGTSTSSETSTLDGELDTHRKPGRNPRSRWSRSPKFWFMDLLTSSHMSCDGHVATTALFAAHPGKVACSIDVLTAFPSMLPRYHHHLGRYCMSFLDTFSHVHLYNVVCVHCFNTFVVNKFRLFHISTVRCAHQHACICWLSLRSHLVWQDFLIRPVSWICLFRLAWISLVWRAPELIGTTFRDVRSHPADLKRCPFAPRPN